jgi:organic radical activating enzyme
MGRPSVFVRLSGCNLRCQWEIGETGKFLRCDTPYASFNPERQIVTVSKVIEIVRKTIKPGDDLVITGGEPMLWPLAVAELCSAFESDSAITIETNGTQPLQVKAETLLYSVSPKLRNSGSGASSAEIIRNINGAATAGVQLKFVVANECDLSEIKGFVADVRRPVDVYLMPLADSEASLAERATWVAEAALSHGFGYSDRLHLRLWKGIRGT